MANKPRIYQAPFIILNDLALRQQMNFQSSPTIHPMEEGNKSQSGSDPDSHQLQTKK
jgi:hypothetical protein